jgi:hypothetical protein
MVLMFAQKIYKQHKKVMHFFMLASTICITTCMHSGEGVSLQLTKEARSLFEAEKNYLCFPRCDQAETVLYENHKGLHMPLAVMSASAWTKYNSWPQLLKRAAITTTFGLVRGALLGFFWGSCFAGGFYYCMKDAPPLDKFHLLYQYRNIPLSDCMLKCAVPAAIFFGALGIGISSGVSFFDWLLEKRVKVASVADCTLSKKVVLHLPQAEEGLMSFQGKISERAQQGLGLPIVRLRPAPSNAIIEYMRMTFHVVTKDFFKSTE